MGASRESPETAGGLAVSAFVSAGGRATNSELTAMLEQARSLVRNGCSVDVVVDVAGELGSRGGSARGLSRAVRAATTILGVPR